MGHVCNYCGKSYIPASSLKKHELIHSGEISNEVAPYKCILSRKSNTNIPIPVIYVIAYQPSKISQQYLLYYPMMTKNIIDKFEPRTFLNHEMWDSKSGPWAQNLDHY